MRKRWLPVGLISVGLLLALLPGVRFALATALFVVGVFPQSPVRPLTLVTPQPTKETIRYDALGQEITADLYQPGGEGPHPGIILYLGANRVGRTDSRLVNLTDGLARLGFVVLVPDSPDLADGRITTREAALLAEGFRHFAGLAGVRADRIGLAGFSVGGAISLLTAADPAVADRIRALELFGAYFDAQSFARSVASETIAVDGTRYAWTPDVLTRTLFRRLVVENLPAEADRVALAGLLSEDDALPAGPLTPGGQAAHELLQRPTYERAAELLEALPVESQAYLEDLSPSRVIGRVTAPLYVLHDQGDRLIPFTESRALVAAVPAEQVRYSELAIFDHVTPRPTAGPLALLVDGLRLFGNVHAYFARLAL